MMFKIKKIDENTDIDYRELGARPKVGGLLPRKTNKDLPYGYKLEYLSSREISENLKGGCSSLPNL